MSAYIVDRGHIRFLVEAPLHLSEDWPVKPGTREAGIQSYYHGRTCHEVNELTQDRIGLMLWAENLRSIDARYPNCKPENRPGPVDDGPERGYTHRSAWNLPIRAIDVLSALACYEYQTCETDDWPETEAHAFCEALRHKAIRCLPGYDNAPWGAPPEWYVEPPLPAPKLRAV